MKLKKNYKKGFTLIELMVVIAIGAVLTVVLLPGFTSARRYAQLDEDVTRVVIMIREAQEQSLYPEKAKLFGSISDSNFLCTTQFRRTSQVQIGITAIYSTSLNSNNKCSNFNPTNINFSTQTLKYSFISDSNDIIGIHFSTPFGEILDNTGPIPNDFSSGSTEKDITLTHSADNNIKRTITVKKSGIIDLK